MHAEPIEWVSPTGVKLIGHVMINVSIARASSNTKNCDISVFTLLIYHGDRTDIGTDKTEDKTHPVKNKPTFRVNHSIRSSFIWNHSLLLLSTY